MHLDDIKKQLIDALELERDMLANNGVDNEDHNKTINYLKTGKVEHSGDIDEEEFPILYCAKEDLTTLCMDYLGYDLETLRNY